MELTPRTGPDAEGGDPTGAGTRRRPRRAAAPKGGRLPADRRCSWSWCCGRRLRAVKALGGATTFYCNADEAVAQTRPLGTSGSASRARRGRHHRAHRRRRRLHDHLQRRRDPGAAPRRSARAVQGRRAGGARGPLRGRRLDHLRHRPMHREARRELRTGRERGPAPEAEQGGRSRSPSSDAAARPPRRERRPRPRRGHPRAGRRRPRRDHHRLRPDQEASPTWCACRAGTPLLVLLGGVLAFVAMERALITRDFTVKYVSDNGSHADAGALQRRHAVVGARGLDHPVGHDPRRLPRGRGRRSSASGSTTRSSAGRCSRCSWSPRSSSS